MVAFGIVATVNLAIGQGNTAGWRKPVCCDFRKTEKRHGSGHSEDFRAVMPMIGASVLVLLLITYVPSVSTFLPKALAGEGTYSGTVVASSDSQADLRKATAAAKILMRSVITVI